MRRHSATADAGKRPEARDAESPLLALLRQHYPARARDMFRSLLELLAATRELCAGDAERSEILLVIALRTVEHPDFSKLTYEQIASGRACSYSSLSTNVRSIADSTGIPRETVRRKVAELVAAEWVDRHGNRLSLSPRVSPAITPLREALLRLVTSNYELLNGLIASSQDPPRAVD